MLHGAGLALNVMMCQCNVMCILNLAGSLSTVDIESCLFAIMPPTMQQLSVQSAGHPGLLRPQCPVASFLLHIPDQRTSECKSGTKVIGNLRSEPCTLAHNGPSACLYLEFGVWGGLTSGLALRSCTLSVLLLRLPATACQPVCMLAALSQRHQQNRPGPKPL